MQCAVTLQRQRPVVGSCWEDRLPEELQGEPGEAGREDRGGQGEDRGRTGRGQGEDMERTGEDRPLK